MLSQMCSNRNNPEEFVTANALRPPNTTILCKKVGPDLGDLGTGSEIGAVLSWGRERLRYYYRSGLININTLRLRRYTFRYNVAKISGRSKSSCDFPPLHQALAP